jgi:hypothetical protein
VVEALVAVVNSKLDTEQRAARDKEMVRQYLSGMSTEKIAELWELTAGRVVQILNKRGVQFRTRGEGA